MYRILVALVALMALTGTAFAEAGWVVSGTLTGGVVADNTTLTLVLPQYMGGTTYLYVPTITASTLALSGSGDNTVFGTIYDEFTNGTTKIAWGVGSTTGGLMLKLPDISVFQKLKITCGSAQAADRTFILYGTRR